MGNRGILHDHDRRMLQTHAHQNWVTCTLGFKGRKRGIMTPGTYPELFFLDEATAFASGHRPCAECRRDRYNSFSGFLQQTDQRHPLDRTLANSINRALHLQRIARADERSPIRRMQIPYQTARCSLSGKHR